MKKIVGLALCVGLLFVVGNAEVFSKKKSTIVYGLSVDKPVDVEFKFKFRDVEQLGSYKAKPNFAVFDHYKKVGDSRHNYINYTFTKNITKLNLPLKKGHYSIVLNAGGGYYDKPFDFSITKVSGNFEIEPNNKFNTATLMSEKSFYYGYLQSNYKQDEDFYKIILKQSSSLDLVFKANEKCAKKDRGYENISLYDGSLKISGGTRVNNPLMKVLNVNNDFRKTIGLKKGIYYIGIRSNYKCIYNKEYALAYITNSKKRTELEPNDSFKNATSITADSYYYNGRLQKKGGEQDFFTFKIDKDENVVFVLKQPNFMKDFSSKWRKHIIPAEFTVYIYDNSSNHNRVTYFYANKKKVTQQRIKLKKGRYFIKIKGLDKSGSVASSDSGTKFLEYKLALIGPK